MTCDGDVGGFGKQSLWIFKDGSIRSQISISILSSPSNQIINIPFGQFSHLSSFYFLFLQFQTTPPKKGQRPKLIQASMRTMNQYYWRNTNIFPYSRAIAIGPRAVSCSCIANCNAWLFPTTLARLLDYIF